MRLLNLFLKRMGRIHPLRLIFCILYSIIVNDVCLYSQTVGFCGTASNIPDFLSELKSTQLKSAPSSYTIGIYFHVIRRSNGTGGQTQQEVNTAFNTLVSDYQPYNIYFSLLGTDEIKNDTYYDYNSSSNFWADQEGHTDLNGDGKFDVFAINSHTNAIDIYLFANDRLNFGLAANIPGTALVIGGNLFNTNLASSHVLSHEVGHCIGLFHTFHGTSLEYEPTGCQELVDGSNGATCGDFVQDTPADPARIVDCGTQSTCTWNCSSLYTDANGAHYTPNTHLIMAYTFPNCMNLHTSGQVARMFSIIANSCLLQNTLAMTISGPTLVCASGGTFTLNNLPEVDSIIWTSGPYLNISSGQNTSSCTYSASSIGSSWVRARLVNSCINIILPQFQVWCGPPQYPTISASLRNWGSYWEIRYFATQINNVTYQWKIDGNIQPFYGPFCSYIAPECGGDPALIFQDFNVEVSVINDCDSTTTCNIFRFACGYSPTITMIGYCGGGNEEMMNENDISINIAPNPAKDNVKVSIYKKAIRIGNALYENRNFTLLPTHNKSYKLRIITSTGLPVFSSNLTDNSISISTASLINGIYIVELNDGIKTFSQQFMIKH